MIQSTSTSRNPSITARPSADEKQRFVELAARFGISESALALIAIRSLLDSNDIPAGHLATPEQSPSTDRITIRLRPGDMTAINERARHRGVRASRYIAGLVRAHLSANPPLTIQELAILKDGVSLLSKFRRALIQATECIAQTGVIPPDLQRELTLCRTVVTALEHRLHDFTRSALKTWECRYE